MVSLKKKARAKPLGRTSEGVVTTRSEPLPPHRVRNIQRGFHYPGAQISIDEVRKGLPLKELDSLAGRLKIDRADLAAILGTSLRTLQRKAEGEELLGPAASDRLARIARLLDLAVHVFGALDKAAIWLTSKSRALENEVPLSLLDTDVGAERVQQELRQIEFGMPF